MAYRNIQKYPAAQAIEPSLGKAHPAASKPHVLRGKHHVARSQGAVFSRPGIFGICGDYDQCRRMMEKMKIGITENRPEMLWLGQYMEAIDQMLLCQP